MDVNRRVDRREFLRSAVISSAVLAGGAPTLGMAAMGSNVEGVSETTPMESLMCAHGALRRILFIYEETIRQIKEKREINPAPLNESASIVDRFIHDYHEKVEEESIFPVLLTARRGVDTVNALMAQHRAGKELTRKTLSMAVPARFKSQSDRDDLASVLSHFVRMYRPHAAREDTVVFFSFKRAVTSDRYKKLREEFEQKEREMCGREDFQKIIARIDRIEKELGIYELSQYSPDA